MKPELGPIRLVPVMGSCGEGYSWGRIHFWKLFFSEGLPLNCIFRSLKNICTCKIIYWLRPFILVSNRKWNRNDYPSGFFKNTAQSFNACIAVDRFLAVPLCVWTLSLAFFHLCLQSWLIITLISIRSQAKRGEVYLGIFFDPMLPCKINL